MNAQLLTMNDSTSPKPDGDNSNAGDGFNRFTAELFKPGNSEVLSLRQSTSTPTGLPEIEFTTADASLPAEVQPQGDTVPEGGLEKAVTAIADDAKDGTIDDLEQLRQVLNTYGPGQSEKFVDDLNAQLGDSGVSAEFGTNRCGVDCGGEVALMQDGEYTDRVEFEFPMGGETIQPEGIDHNFG